MKPTIYLPSWFIQLLSNEAQAEIFKARYLSKSAVYGYMGNEFEIKLIEDDLYSNCASQFANIHEKEEKLLELEKEVQYLRQIKQSVDEMKKLFK